MNTKSRFDRVRLRNNIVILSQNKTIPLEKYIWNNKNKVVYGPILSRRLGRSLGINLFPSDFKICNFDCIYCDCGPTKKNRIRGFHFVPVDKIKEELKSSFEHHFSNKTFIDHITFAGNGEPTYYPFFQEIVNFVLELKDMYFPQKTIAIFSNGSMISNLEITRSILKLKEKIFKLDAGDKRTFNLINRPNDFSFKKYINMLIDLREIKISSAVLCSGISNFSSLKSYGYIEALKMISPLEVHLYSIDYFPAYQGVRRARISKMLDLAQYITSNMDVKIKVLQARKAW